MNPKTNTQFRKFLLAVPLAVLALAVYFLMTASPVARAQGAPTPTPNPYYAVNLVTLGDGTVIEEHIIKGPPAPPPGYELEMQPVPLPEPDPMAGTNSLTVPAYPWVFGCSAVSAAMIAGYYDRIGWSNMYTGPTNGGVMPLLYDSSWGTWEDDPPSPKGHFWYYNNPLVASRNGLDGRTTRGSIDDYWVEYFSNAPDPYITGGWTQHTWGDALGDYMKTSQSAFDHADAITSFYEYSSATPFTCDSMKSLHLDDGTLGRKLFYEARGYTVTDCYNQKTDNVNPKGFSFAQFKAEIDAGRPVMLNLTGHTVVGVGYDATTNLVYIHDTWNGQTHSMTWGGSYYGMSLEAVSIVNLQPPLTLLSPSGSISDTQPYYTWKSSSGATSYRLMVWSVGSASYIIQRNVSTAYCSGATCSIKPDGTLAPGKYRFKVLARYATGTSPYSAFMNFTVAGGVVPAAPTLLSPSGTILDTQPTYSWNASTGAASYRLAVWSVGSASYAVLTDVPASACSGGVCSFMPATPLSLGAYRFKVLARNATGSSPYSAWMNFTVTVPLPAAPTLISPKDTITETQPFYSWNPSSGADSYYLAVYSYGLARYVDLEDVPGSSCSDPGDGIIKCRTQPSVTLAWGDYFFKVLSKNAGGPSPYSANMTFYVSPLTIPPVPTPELPTGTIADPHPPYVWDALDTAAYYRLAVWSVSLHDYVFVTDVYNSFCDSGTNKCTYHPETALATLVNGNYRFKVLARNAAGSSLYSAWMDFIVAPPP